MKFAVSAANFTDYMIFIFKILDMIRWKLHYIVLLWADLLGLAKHNFFMLYLTSCLIQMPEFPNFQRRLLCVLCITFD